MFHFIPRAHGRHGAPDDTPRAPDDPIPEVDEPEEEEWDEDFDQDDPLAERMDDDDAKNRVAVDTFDGDRSQKLHVHYIEAEVPVPAREAQK